MTSSTTTLIAASEPWLTTRIAQEITSPLWAPLLYTNLAISKSASGGITVLLDALLLLISGS